MKYVDNSDDYEFGFLVKEKELKNGDRIELWMVEENHVVRDYLFDKHGYCIWVEMGSLGQLVDCSTNDMFVACQKFNTIYATLGA